ncbi:hypothetical protein ANRL2_04604 [Anaerolineae bacterium]|nr:hypothetical protein ANRL2_04604 [Anaerolineae bacterium]
MQRYISPVEWNRFQACFDDLIGTRQGFVLRRARNRKGREVPLVCVRTDKGLVPLARLIDSESRSDYEIIEAL